MLVTLSGGSSEEAHLPRAKKENARKMAKNDPRTGTESSPDEDQTSSTP